ncbi:cyclin-dependent kinase inhibitor 1B-like [Alosa pseudoharengus]|uniref:cyclin-dependent kinase inhibitor 1C n=1 Tax=Alosa sapidissima TaxID=34773 RepID=UPI001C088E52|nr:cyclin-dependent kinase inhibitor 1C [Alosa sapidissima]XP_048113022.1 cyclin-dependent kinase inhibitor 1C [Alosa alosa]
MTNVQISTSTLERLLARRTFPLHARTGVCRNLFGPVDHDELNREMKSKLREISELDQRKWNFNFERDEPLRGDYEWEESPLETSPAFYHESAQIGRSRVVLPVNPSVDSRPRDCTAQDAPVHCEDRLAGSEVSAPCSSEVNQENCADTLNSGKRSRKVNPNSRRKRSTASDLTTTHITDFYVKRRRTMGAKPGENVCQQSSTPLPIEQTPRKRIR